MRAATLLGAGVVLTVLAGTVPASGGGLAATASSPTRAMAAFSDGLDLRLTPDATIAAVGARRAVADLVAPPGTRRIAVNFHATGVARALGDTSTTLATRAGKASHVDVDWSAVRDGSGTIELYVRSVDRRGKVLATDSATLWVLRAGGRVLSGTAGLLDLQARQIRALDGLSGLERARRLDRVLGAGASTSTSTRADTGTAVLGTILFTDRDGETHAVRRASVKLFEVTATGDKPLGADDVKTDARGIYRFDITAPRAAIDIAHSNGYNVKVRAYAQGPGYSVKGSEGVYYIYSALPPPADPDAGIRVPIGYEKTINLTANNTGENDKAFSLADAMLDIQDYTESSGTRIPDLDVRYPSAANPRCSCYDSTTKILHMNEEDAFDYDTAHHEFAHYLMEPAQFGIADTPGGDHDPPYNLSEKYKKDKNFGIHLAWSEAWPTYYGTMLQDVVGAADRGIPGLGDTWYDATNKNPMNGAIEQSRYDLEGKIDNKGPGPWPNPASGEDNEYAVQRFLWDMYDDTPNEPGDLVSLPDQQITDRFRDEHATSFSDAYRALVKNAPYRQRAEIGCIAAYQEISPMITVPKDGSALTTDPPKITWTRNGGGPTYLNNSFVVQFYDAAFTTLLYQTGNITAPLPAKAGDPTVKSVSYVPTDNWTSIRGRSPTGVNIVVQGRQTANSVTGQTTATNYVTKKTEAIPVTGPYDSCAVSLVKK